MLTLSNLSPHPGSRKQKKRLGRGQGSGRGKTAARGQNGAKSRSGYSVKPGFEGGQMPLQRRLPKRGFTNIFKKQYSIVNVQDLDCFEAGTRVDRGALISRGLVGKNDQLIKLLGKGEINKALTVSFDKVSTGARAKIEGASGSIENSEK